jgi:topoisomerase-4 subunit A
VAEVKVLDEPVTVVHQRKGLGACAHRAMAMTRPVLPSRRATACMARLNAARWTRSSSSAATGACTAWPVSALPGARGDGQPITTMIELESGTQPLHYYAGAATSWLLLSGSGGYGFLATVENMFSRQKAGKSFISIAEGETVCRPSPANIAPPAGVVPLGLYLPATHVCCVAASRRVLTFPISELKVMAGGGRGLMLMDLDKKDSLAGAAAYTRSVKITGVFRDKEREEVLEIRSLNNAMASRGRKGKDGSFTFKPVSVERVE